MKTLVAFRFSTAASIAVNSCLKAGISHLIYQNHHFKKRKNNELHNFTT
jgi:hypothetical protein